MKLCMGTKLEGNFRSNVPRLFRQHIEIIVVVLAALVLYLTFMSRSFDEWDAYNFGLALTRYDVSAHQPHAPGYPVFVFIASVIYHITKNPLLSLTSVSAVSGALTLIPTYVIAKRLFNRETAFFSVLALMFAPGFWLASEQALSDMLFTFLLTLAMSFLLIGRTSKLHLYASWGILGLALAVRPFNVVFAAPFLMQIARLRRERAYCVVTLLSTFLFAFLPAIMLTGYSQYLKTAHYQLIDQITTQAITANPLGLSEIARPLFPVLTLVTQGLGANLPFRILPFYPFTSDSPFAELNFSLLLFLAGSGLALLKHIRDFSKAIFVVLWIMPYFLFVYLLASPLYSRYWLPILPPLLIILVASGLETVRFIRFSLARKSAIANMRTFARYGLAVFLVASMFGYSLPLAETIHTQLTPEVQLVNFVRSNYSPLTTTIIVFHEFRAFQFYGGEFRYVRCLDPRKTLVVAQSSFGYDQVLITSSALSALSASGIRLQVLKVAEFFRNPPVTAEDQRVVLYRILSLPSL